jgi:hypothetical protein
MPAVEIYDAIVELLASSWSATPVVYENQTQPPVSAEGAHGLSPWVLVEIEGRSMRQLSMGAGTKPENLWDEQGTAYLHVHVPVGSGSRDARVLADGLTQLFKATESVGAIQFENMSIGSGEIGRDNGKWWSMTVAVDWRNYQG